MKCLTYLAVTLPISLSACDAASDAARAQLGKTISFYRLRAPADAHDIEQASGLHYGQLGEREGLWIVSDRNGGRSTNTVFFFSSSTLAEAVHEQSVIADEAFRIVPPGTQWSEFLTRNSGLDIRTLNELKRRLAPTTNPTRDRVLDLEAITIGPATTSPDEQHLFVAAEEPLSTVLELALDRKEGKIVARLVAAFGYAEAPGESGTDRNDGLEGLACAGNRPEFYWAEEGTVNHGGQMGSRLFFLNPRVGKAKLITGRVQIDKDVSDALTQAAHKQRDGPMQTLNALATTPDGRLLAVDRNGGWILRIDPQARTVRRWLNLYDLHGVNLRDALADFPESRHMPYISIEGIGVQLDGTLWLVDDPAIPEGFRASSLLRVNNAVTTQPAP